MQNIHSIYRKIRNNRLVPLKFVTSRFLMASEYDGPWFDDSYPDLKFHLCVHENESWAVYGTDDEGKTCYHITELDEVPISFQGQVGLSIGRLIGNIRAKKAI